MTRHYLIWGLLGVLGCAPKQTTAELPRESTHDETRTIPGGESTSSEPKADNQTEPILGAAVVFTGMCDASGAVPLSATTFMVADDEDNVLRVYDVERGGAPLWSKDISSELGLPERPGKPAREMDLEAATRVGEYALWLTSYARNSSGKIKEERFRIFATTMPTEQTEARDESAHAREMRVVGYAGDSLLDALLADPRYNSFDLKGASQLAPKAEGGMNIEGMTERFEGGVWIGFRNPNPNGRALLVPLLNPIEMIKGAIAQLGDPRLLDLGGFGVRSLSSWHGEYLIAAGHYDRDLDRPSVLYRWDGKNKLKLVDSAHLGKFNPEGFFTPEQREEIMFLSDDGTEVVGGVECKRQKDPAQKQFRGVWVRL